MIWSVLVCGDRLKHIRSIVYCLLSCCG